MGKPMAQRSTGWKHEPVKVLHVIDSLGVGGGAEHSLAKMLPLLRSRGVDSSLAVLIPREGGLQQQLREMGFPLHVIEGRSWPAKVLDLRKLIDTSHPDLVHATLYYSSLASRLATAFTKVPLINSRVSTSYDPARTMHNATSSWKLRLVRSADQITARPMVDHIHAVTDEVAEEATRVLRFPPARITVVKRGRSLSELGESSAGRRIATRRQLGIDEGTTVILNVGRQDHAKDHVTLVRAFDRVLNHDPSAVMLLAGREGDATPRLLESIAESRAQDAVRLLGHRTDVADLCVASDLFAFPSLYEGAAGSLLEAMALQLPIVGSDAVADVLGDGQFGVITPRSDSERLANEIISLLDEPSRMDKLKRSALHEFNTSYNIESIADQTVNMYRKVLGHHVGSERQRNRVKATQ